MLLGTLQTILHRRPGGSVTRPAGHDPHQALHTHASAALHGMCTHGYASLNAIQKKSLSSATDLCLLLWLPSARLYPHALVQVEHIGDLQSCTKPLICIQMNTWMTKFSNIRRTKSQNLNVSRLGLQLSLHNISCWSQILSGEWRCSWSSADRWCSNYIRVINNLMTN